MTDLMLESRVGDAAVLLDIARNEQATMPSPSRIAYALQNDIPLITDSIYDFSGSIYEPYVTQMTIDELVGAVRDMRSQGFVEQMSRAARFRSEQQMKYLMFASVEMAIDACGMR